VAAISHVAIRFRKGFPYLMLGWLWYLGTLVPVIGLVQVGAQSMADRYNYIPSIGLFIMICWGAHDLTQTAVRVLNNQYLQTHDQWVPGTLCLATLVMCGLAASNQLQCWRDGGTLFRHAIAVDPDNFVARGTYGIFLYEHGSLPEAILELRKTVQIMPQFPRGHALLGKVLYSAGQRDAAAAELRIALQLRPGEVDAHNDLGSILMDQNLPGEAAAEFASALQYEPDNPATLCLLGRALVMQGRLDEAREQFSKALRLNPWNADAHYQLARALAMQHEPTEAIAQYWMALRLQPAMPDALNNLAWILATDPDAEIRKGFEAVKLARRACILTRNADPLTIGTLAAGYAEIGDFDAAIAYAQKAHDLAVAQGRNEMAAKNAEMLELYRSHHPYHQ
jgi:cytochrome c-type biogenesis protein CcmH/NrfG